MTTIIIGDSHVNALREGADLLQPNELASWSGKLKIGSLGTGSIALKPFSKVINGKVVFDNPRYSRAFLALNVRGFFRTGGVKYGISFGFHSLPVVANSVWRDASPWRIASKYGRVPVSSGVLAAMMNANNKHMHSFYEQLLASGIDFFAISAPPLRADHPIFSELEAEVVLEVDREFRKASAAFFEQRGIPVVYPPEIAYSSDGILRHDLAKIAPDDTHHGNSEYGAMMLRHILTSDIVQPRGSFR
jgi:hypothetical protein